MRLIIKPNRTLNIQANATRTLLKIEHSKTVSELRDVTNEFYGNCFMEDHRDKSEAVWRFYLRPNFGGRHYLKQMLLVLESSPSKPFFALAGNRQVRLLAALRLYELDHGSLPSAIDSLIPTYLNALPADPVDGQAMRYQLSSRKVYGLDQFDKTDEGPKKNRSLHLGWSQD